jgi:flagellar hook-associated protein 2
MADVSGVSDIQGYVTQLINLERTTGPEQYYQDRKSDLTLKNSTLTDLDSNLSALNTQIQSLLQPGTLSPLLAKTVSFSTTGYATATASSSAASGAHTLVVSQLARQSTVLSNSMTATGTSIAGSVLSGNKTFRLSVAGVDTDVTVAVDQNADTNLTVLTNMASAINASGARVTASVVWDTASTVRLSIASKDSGSANALSVQDRTGTLLSATGVSSAQQTSGSAGGYLYASGALDATLNLDGLNFTRASNTITDLLPGVTLNLTAAQSASSPAISFTVGADQGAVKSKVQAFLDAYNASTKFLKDRTGITVTTDTSASSTNAPVSVTRGTLSGDFTYMGLRMNLRSDIGGRISSATANGPNTLYAIGITAAADGTLSISDSTKFTNAVTNDPEGVTALFSSSDGIATRLSNRLTGFVKTGGILDNSQTAVASGITNMNNAIAAQEKLLKIRQTQLTQQYEALAAVMNQLQMQQGVVTSYMSSLGF